MDAALATTVAHSLDHLNSLEHAPTAVDREVVARDLDALAAATKDTDVGAHNAARLQAHELRTAHQAGCWPPAPATISRWSRDWLAIALELADSA